MVTKSRRIHIYFKIYEMQNGIENGRAELCCVGRWWLRVHDDGAEWCKILLCLCVRFERDRKIFALRPVSPSGDETRRASTVVAERAYL